MGPTIDMVYIRKGMHEYQFVGSRSVSYGPTRHVSFSVGAVVDRPGLVARLVRVIQNIIEVILLFFKTILDPQAASEFTERQQRRQRTVGGHKLGGGTYPQRSGPRIAGLGDLKDAGGNCAAGA